MPNEANHTPPLAANAHRALKRPRALSPFRATVLATVSMGQNPYALGQSRPSDCARNVSKVLLWLEASQLLRAGALTTLGRLVLRREFERVILRRSSYYCRFCGRVGLTADDMRGKAGRIVQRCKICQTHHEANR